MTGRQGNHGYSGAMLTALLGCLLAVLSVLCCGPSPHTGEAAPRPSASLLSSPAASLPIARISRIAPVAPSAQDDKGGARPAAIPLLSAHEGTDDTTGGNGGKGESDSTCSQDKGDTGQVPLLPGPVPLAAPASFPVSGPMAGGAGIRGPSHDAAPSVDLHRLQVQRT